MLKVVVDTNVIISGFNFAGSKPAKILDLVVQGWITNCVSLPIIEETRRILVRKFSWTDREAEAASQWLSGFSELLNPDFRLSVIAHDDQDNRILECALKAGADYIITGDRHLLSLHIYQGVSIVNPATFLKLFKE